MAQGVRTRNLATETPDLEIVKPIIHRLILVTTESTENTVALVRTGTPESYARSNPLVRARFLIHGVCKTSKSPDRVIAKTQLHAWIALLA